MHNLCAYFAKAPVLTSATPPKAPKRAVNLSLNAKVLDTARELGLNISATVDALLAEEVKKRYWERWNEDNKEAIAHYNARIAKEGLPLAKYRTFMKGV
jgi:antitoxin CcdA